MANRALLAAGVRAAARACVESCASSASFCQAPTARTLDMEEAASMELGSCAAMPNAVLGTTPCERFAGARPGASRGACGTQPIPTGVRSQTTVAGFQALKFPGAHTHP